MACWAWGNWLHSLAVEGGAYGFVENIWSGNWVRSWEIGNSKVRDSWLKKDWILVCHLYDRKLHLSKLQSVKFSLCSLNNSFAFSDSCVFCFSSLGSLGS